MGFRGGHRADWPSVNSQSSDSSGLNCTKGHMSFCALRKGTRVKIALNEFVIVQRIPDAQWQLQNTATGEWCTFLEADLLDRFTGNELSFVIRADESGPVTDRLAANVARDLSFYSPSWSRWRRAEHAISKPSMLASRSILRRESCSSSSARLRKKSMIRIRRDGERSAVSTGNGSRQAAT